MWGDAMTTVLKWLFAFALFGLAILLLLCVYAVVGGLYYVFK